MFSKTIDSKTTYINNDNIEMVDLGRSIFNSAINNSAVYSYYKVGRGMSMRPDKISYAAYNEDTYTEMILKYSLIDNPFAISEGDVIAIPSITTMYTDVSDITLSGDDGDKNYQFVKNYHKYIDSSKIPEIKGSSGSSISNKNKKANILLNNPNKDNNEITFDNLGIRESYGNIMGYGSELYNSNAVPINTVLVDEPTNNVSYDDEDIPVQEFDNISSSEYGPVEANMANNGKSGISLVNGRIYFGSNNVSANINDVTDVDGTNIADSELVDCARTGTTIGQFLNATLKNTVKNG